MCIRQGYHAREGPNIDACRVPSTLGVYKIWFHFEAYVHESILFIPPPPVLPTLLHGYCTTTTQHTTAIRPRLCMSYTIEYWSWQYRVKAKSIVGQCTHRQFIYKGDTSTHAQKQRNTTLTLAHAQTILYKRANNTLHVTRPPHSGACYAECVRSAPSDDTYRPPCILPV